MRNVNMINLRIFFKSSIIGLSLLLFVLAGSAFTSFTKSEAGKVNISDSTSLYKSVFRSLIPGSYYDPAKPVVTTLNPKAISFVQRYVRNEGENLEKMKIWGKPYLNIYDNILARYGLPKELKYLSVIESSLVSNTTSPSGAVGPWQIMPSEAIRLGLKVNDKKDERKNFIKSTNCAAKILRGLHQQFGDWLVVVAAYNCGEGRIRQAIKQSGRNDFWGLQAYLPEETRCHVKRFIGTHYIFEGNGGLTAMTSAEYGI